MRWLFPVYFSLSTAALVASFVVHFLRQEVAMNQVAAR
jgi:hypothetical protein